MEPRRKPQAILRVIGSKCKPNEGIGIAYNQSDALGDETDKILAISLSSLIDLSKFSYLNS